MLRSLDRSIRNERSEMIESWITFWQESEFGALRSSIFDEGSCFLVIFFHFHRLQHLVSARVFPIWEMRGCGLRAHNWIELDHSHFMNWRHLVFESLTKKQMAREEEEKNNRKRDG